MAPRYLTPLLWIDGIGSALAGAALIVAAAPLAEPFGLATPLPLTLLGVVFVANGAANLRGARRPAPGTLAPLVATDLTFAVLMLALAAADPTGAETPARWALAALGVASVDLGAAKWYGMRRLAGRTGRALPGARTATSP